ncbi:helix-turn-helix domain-containing protein [Streptomyces sp. B3I8]|uniref:helix-turn-helix domain-containing protein n=1 Tax=Streptomyces sp. B3I8 TaxID=3042303 RepID=UPI002787D988|nr:helix-turn-helix transcriptional regulator [Streptomyces sp. B3I8]MDQ0786000.1 transcriptional regulator with XRE-family HTH domain [Streptomyces sp. B3I8]
MTTATDTGEVGPLLRGWRERRRFSQQELSNRSSVSTRHLSRVETGRARPTPEMILHLADHLDVPLRERNRLLLAGGYAPRYRDRGLDDASVALVMEGLRGLLDAHLPYPALLLDDYWDVVDSNAGVDVLLAGCAPELLEPPVNVIRLCLHPGGLAPRIGNFTEWASHLYHQLVHRAERSHDPRHLALAEEAGSHLAGTCRTAPVGSPVLTLELATDGGDLLRFFSTSARLSTPTDAALEGLHMETFLPADASTRRRFARPPHGAGETGLTSAPVA